MPNQPAYREHAATIERIISAADGRALTAPQQADFDVAYKAFQKDASTPIRDGIDALAELPTRDAALADPVAAANAIKSWLAVPRSMGRFVSGEQPTDGPDGGGYSGASALPGRKSMHDRSWGAKVVQHGTMSGTKALVASGSVPVTVPLNPTPVVNARGLRFLRELIPGVAVEGTNFSYLRQTVRTNNAAPVAEGALKPTSVYTLERVDAKTETIAHLTEPIPRQQLDDAAILQSFVDDELRYGLDRALDTQLLSGTGVAPQLTGILTTVGILTVVAGTDALIRARAALTALEVVDLEPTGYVFSPADWSKVETVALATFASNSNAPAATDLMARRLFGIPVLVTNGIAAGTALLGAFASSCYLAVTQEARIDWSENTYDPDALGAGVGATDFARNMIRFRAEARYGLAVTRPTGFVKITIA